MTMEICMEKFDFPLCSCGRGKAIYNLSCITSDSDTRMICKHCKNEIFKTNEGEE